MPKLLFLPVSGPKGSGEFYRSLTIARAARERWPDAQIAFIVSRDARYASELRQGPDPFIVHLTDGTPTLNTPAVNQVIETFKPDVAIFDSSGRRAQLLCARRNGVKTVYISSRPKARQKGFRLRRMRLLDQHWLAWPGFLGGDPRAWERFKLRLAPALEVVPLGVVFAPPDAERGARLLARMGLRPGKYLIFCGGGGGYSAGGRSAPEIFAEAAAGIRAEEDLSIVWIRGPNYTGPKLERPGITGIDSLDTASMIDLLAGARLAVINGGSLLLQAIALKVPSVCAPVARDQRQRIGACAALGLTVPSALDAAALAAATQSLLDNRAHRSSLRQRLETVSMNNGVHPAIDALARLMSNRPEVMRSQ
jgi:hypothetical protein